MATIDEPRRLIHVKIAYLGPGLSGRSTNLKFIHSRSAPGAVSQMRPVFVGSSTDDPCLVLSFEVAPQGLEVGGFGINFHLYAAPGMQFDSAGRLAVMREADGVVMVVDSQLQRLDASLEAFENMGANFHSLGVDPATVPVVFQLNKRDLPHAMPVKELQPLFGFDRAIEAVAPAGIGVFESFKAIARELLLSLKSETR